ncbi:MAG: M24 family metallopeptidase [Rhizobiaceae bacterium]
MIKVKPIGIVGGFDQSEYLARTNRAQKLLSDNGLEALLVTTEAEFRYFSGFLTRFWESPTRPWFLIVPATGQPVAVVPSIGAGQMSETWISDIRTWDSPDPEDDGVSLLADTLCELTSANARIGLPDGHETHVRMPRADLERVRTRIGDRVLTGDNGIIRSLRMIKSQSEIDKIEMACAIAGRAFSRIAEIIQPEISMKQIFRSFQILCLEEGADWVPYLAGGAGPVGYRDAISPAGEELLSKGDILMLDTGLVHDGYFCDYCRNWSIGKAKPELEATHARLIEAADASFEIARPGATASDLFHVMDRIVSPNAVEKNAGRLGHGLGMSLTEWPSLMADDHTILEPGMVLTLEPFIVQGDHMIVHEENIVVTEDAPRYLSPRIGPELPILS